MRVASEEVFRKVSIFVYLNSTELGLINGGSLFSFEDKKNDPTYEYYNEQSQKHLLDDHRF